MSRREGRINKINDNFLVNRILCFIDHMCLNYVKNAEVVEIK